MDKKKILNLTTWFLIFFIILINGYLLLKLKKNSLEEAPLTFLNIKKPTLVVLLDEFECADCVKKLLFLNQIYSQLKSERRLDIAGVIFSQTKTDVKKISRVFKFPIYISDDFRIFKRINLNRTPIILGLTEKHQIVYSELIPMEATLTEYHIKETVLDRLYYSETF